MRLHGKPSGFKPLRRLQEAHIRSHERMNAEHSAYYEELLRKHGGVINQDVKFKLPPAPKSWILIGLSSFYGTLLIDYLLSDWLVNLIYEQWFPDYYDTMGRHLFAVLLMMIVFGIIVMIVRLFFDPGRSQISMFVAWMGAMRRMSKGDFDVTLDFDVRYTGQMGVIVQNFNQMVAALREMEQMRQEFISNVSHEFQSPLTSISGFARALQNEQLPPDTRKHYLDIIELESVRLSRLSDNLLKLTSLESKHHPFEPGSYRLDRQIRRIVLAWEPLWREKNIEIDIDFPSLPITADEELLDQVWINLLNNSIKFTPVGGTISIDVTATEGGYRIEVADNGRGIPEEHLPHLFERFYKADQSRNRTGESNGSGLGLSIVRKIVEMHEGTVFAGNRAGGGAVFTVHLPVLAQPTAR
ncbi:sensor histidine kinase [Cohnella panacarvi]|uniref:sensor histidine kinase n=1 Tax=Cohnella panacarvi TaxID=400776 RepID=UPI0004793B3F|nr:HAMP domain-containing sensor histidine kinase [Cohnella panacarvi]